MNHDTFATDCQRLKLSIRSIQKTWSVFADAFAASAHEFGICTPKFSLAAVINWHLNYEGPNAMNFSMDLSTYRKDRTKKQNLQF